MTDQVASKMSKSSTNPTNKNAGMKKDAGAIKTGAGLKKGEKFRCNQCGMEIQVTGECGCNNPDHAHFECCNQQMAKA